MQILPLGATGRLSVLLAFSLVGESAFAQSGCDWGSRTDGPITRIEAPGVVVDGKVFVLGGFTAPSLTASSRVDAYDPATDTWTPKAPLPIPVTHEGFAVDGDTIWIVGGYSGNHPGTVVADVYSYDTVNDSWSPGPALPGPRGSGAAAILGRQLHYFGGTLSDRDTNSPDHWVLDLDNPTAWTPLAPLPDARAHLSGVALGGLIYAVGGQYRHDTNPEDLDLVHAYDPTTDTWTQKASLPTPRSHFEPGTFIQGDRIVAAGGRNNTAGAATLADLVAYDPHADRWSTFGGLPQSLIAPTVQAIGTEIVLTGGGLNPVLGLTTTQSRDASTFGGGLVRSNAGGSSFVSSSNEDWCADYGFLGGFVFALPSQVDIGGTDDDELYHTERYADNASPTRLVYRFPVGDGAHRVRLHFAEIFHTEVNRRVFDVFLEGRLVRDDLDLVAEIGANHALVLTHDVLVEDGDIEIEMISSADRPKISGIEITPRPGSIENYCSAGINSVGSSALLSHAGSTSVGENNLSLHSDGCPPGVTGLYFYGSSRSQVPLGQGTRCVGFPLFRLYPLVFADSVGAVRRPIDYTALRPMGAILPGSTWHFQLWYRDGQTSNASDGLTLEFTP